MTPNLTNLTFGQRPARPALKALPDDATLIAEITAVPDWRHWPIRKLASQLRYLPQPMMATVARLQASGQLATASPIGLIRLARVRQLNAVLAEPGLHQLGDVVARLYGRDTSGHRAQLKDLIREAVADALPLPCLPRLHLPTADKSVVKAQHTLTYCQWSDLDPAHRARFVALLRDLAPTRTRRQEVSHAA